MSAAVSFRVEVELKETSQKLVYDDAVNAYTKGPLYCVYRQNGTSVKFPLDNIWRVTETYRATSPDPKFRIKEEAQ